MKTAMNLVIEGNRASTASPYDIKIVRILGKIEGLKKWKKDRTFSFEATPYNLEIWKATFPESTIRDSSGQTFTRTKSAIRQIKEVAPFRFNVPPREHQKIALAKARNQKSFGMFLDIGCGKSYCGIVLAAMRYCAGESEHLLLIAPNGIQIQWVLDENEEPSPFKKYCCASWRASIYKPNSNKFERDFQSLLKFSGLKILAINIDAITTKSAEKTILEFIRAANGNATIYIDESQDIKTWNSNRTVMALKLGNLCEYRMIFTGTPISKNLIDLFSQFQFLDESILGHRYITTFKNFYCEFQQTDFGPIVTGHKNVEELYRRIDPYIYRITSKEALDLPEKLFIASRFDLTKEQKSLMDDLRSQFFAEFGNDQIAIVKNAVGLLLRLQQISCGFIIDSNNENKIEVLDKNPRLDDLLRIVEQRSDKIIVWCRFQKDVEICIKALGASNCVDYYGPTKRDDRQRNKIAFIEDENVRFFVATADTGGSGLDGLQRACATSVYYSNSFNAIDRWQSEGRTWRDGTTKTATYFDLIARNSPDGGILQNLRKKKDISDLTLDEYRMLIISEEKE